MGVDYQTDFYKMLARGMSGSDQRDAVVSAGGYFNNLIASGNFKEAGQLVMKYLSDTGNMPQMTGQLLPRQRLNLII